MDGKPLIQCLEDDIEHIIDQYVDQGLTVGEIIGTLELAKLAFWDSQCEEDQI